MGPDEEASGDEGALKRLGPGDFSHRHRAWLRGVRFYVVESGPGLHPFRRSSEPERLDQKFCQGTQRANDPLVHNFKDTTPTPLWNYQGVSLFDPIPWCL